MKTIILFFFLTAQYFAQVQGGQAVGELDSAGTNYHHCPNATQWAILNIKLSAVGDTVLVDAGSNFSDSTVANQWWGQIAVTDMFTGGVVPVITGNTTTYRKYFIDTKKQKRIRLRASTNAGDLPYSIEFY